MHDTPHVADRHEAVCVIGAGASGLATVKNLLQHGFAVDCYERETSVGGAWRTVADGLVDAGAAASSSAPTFPATLPRQRLDAVFVTPDITIEKYEVIDTDRARRASDHLPVLTDLLLPSS